MLCLAGGTALKQRWSKKCKEDYGIVLFGIFKTVFLKDYGKRESV